MLIAMTSKVVIKKHATRGVATRCSGKTTRERWETRTSFLQGKGRQGQTRQGDRVRHARQDNSKQGKTTLSTMQGSSIHVVHDGSSAEVCREFASAARSASMSPRKPKPDPVGPKRPKKPKQDKEDNEYSKPLEDRAPKKAWRVLRESTSTTSSTGATSSTCPAVEKAVKKRKRATAASATTLEEPPTRGAEVVSDAESEDNRALLDLIDDAIVPHVEESDASTADTDINDDFLQKHIENWVHQISQKTTMCNGWMAVLQEFKYTEPLLRAVEQWSVSAVSFVSTLEAQGGEVCAEDTKRFYIFCREQVGKFDTQWAHLRGTVHQYCDGVVGNDEPDN